MLVNAKSAVCPIAWAIAVVSTVLFIMVVGIAVKSRRQKIQNGLIVLVGAQGKTLGDINCEGQAIIHGEIWSVRSRYFIAAHQPVIVVATSGIILEIELAKDSKQGE